MRRVSTLGAVLGLVMAGIVVLSPSPASAAPVRVEWESGGCSGSGSGWQSAAGGSGGFNCQNSVGWTTKSIKTITMDSPGDVKVYGWRWPSGSPNGRYRVDSGTTVNWSAYNTPDALTSALLFTVTLSAGSHSLEVWSDTVHYMVLDYYELPEPMPLTDDIPFPAYDCIRQMTSQEFNGDTLWWASAYFDQHEADTGDPALDLYSWQVFWLPDHDIYGRRTSHPEDAYAAWALPRTYNNRTPAWQVPTELGEGKSYQLIGWIKRVTPDGHGFAGDAPDFTADGGFGPFEPTRIGNHEEVAIPCYLLADPSKPDEGAGNSTGKATPGGDTYWERTDPVVNDPDDCIPGGFGILNPANFVKASVCMMKWAFVPDWGEATEELSDALDGSVLETAGAIENTVTGSWGALASAADANSSSCEGPSFTLPISTLGNPHIAMLSTCSAPASTWAPIVRGIAVFGLVLMVGFAALRGIGRVIGQDGGGV